MLSQFPAERLVQQGLFQIVQCGEFAFIDGGDRLKCVVCVQATMKPRALCVCGAFTFNYR